MFGLQVLHDQQVRFDELVPVRSIIAHIDIVS